VWERGCRREGSTSHGAALGRDENIGATVTVFFAVLRYWIFLTRVTVFDSAVIFYFSALFANINLHF
jgi:hypothetical protein